MINILNKKKINYKGKKCVVELCKQTSYVQTSENGSSIYASHISGKNCLLKFKPNINFETIEKIQYFVRILNYKKECVRLFPVKKRENSARKIYNSIK